MERKIKTDAMESIDEIASKMPTLVGSLITWTIRSLIAVGIAYGINAWLDGPSWLITAVWIYVAFSLIASLILFFIGHRTISNAKSKIGAAADRLDQSLENLDD